MGGMLTYNAINKMANMIAAFVLLQWFLFQI